MSSFDEYRKKLQDKYGNDEEKSVKKITTNGKSSFDDFRSNMLFKYASNKVTSSDVESWFKDTAVALNTAQYYKDKNNGQYASAAGEMGKSINDLMASSGDIYNYLQNHKSEYGNFKEINDLFSKYRADLEQLDLENYNLSRSEHSEEGRKGWEKYLADVETEKSETKTPAWQEAIIRGFTTSSDIPANMAFNNLVYDYSKDVSYARPQDNWDENQKGIFGALYLKSPEEAYEYAIATNNKNNKAAEEEALKKISDSATSEFWAGAGHTAGAIAAAPLGMADFINDIAMINAGRPVTYDGVVSPFEYSQAVTGGIAENLNKMSGTIDEDVPVFGGKGLGDAYGLGTSIVQSFATRHAFGPLGTLVAYFGQAAASSVDDALARGATDEQALLLGIANGISEAIPEALGTEHLFTLGSSSTIKGFIKNILSQAGAEGMEEGLTSLFSNIADNVIMQDKSNFNYLVAVYMAQGMSKSEAEEKAWKTVFGDMAFDVIAGGVSGAVSGAAETGFKNTVRNHSVKKNYGNYAQNIVNEAVASDNSEVKALGEKYQEKLNKGKNLSGGNLNLLLEVTGSEKVKSAVKEELVRMGETEDVSRLAEIITKQMQGYDLKHSEKKALNNSKYGQTEKAAKTSNSIAKETPTERDNAPSTSVNASNKEIATESEFKASEDGKTRIGDTEVSIKEIASVKDGEITLRLDDGSTVKAIDVEFGSSDEGLLYENVVRMGLNAATANAFINGYDGSMSVSDYAFDFRQAYRYGELGIPKSEMSAKEFSSRLTESVKDLAYNHGAIDAKYKASEKQSVKAKIASTGVKNTENIASKGKKNGKLHNTLKPRNELQRTSLKALGVLAEALNIDIYTFESPLVNGRRVGENGSYDPVTRTMRIDLYAGADGKGTMLFTAAHELTHHIREKLPAKFKAFADFLFEQYGEKGISVSELIANKRADLEANGRTKGKTEAEIYDLAYEEVVADACESFLADGEAVAKIAELKAKDKTLWETIKDFITKLVARIKAAYEGLTPDSLAGSNVAEMLDSAEQLQAMWTEMLVEASEVSDLVEVDMDTESVAPMFSERTWTASEYVTEREKTAKAISKSLNVDINTALKYIDDINGVARLIADDRARLDYEPNLDEKATVLKPNSDYKFSVDMSTLCAKRLLFTGTFDAIQRALPNMVFDSEDIVSLREMMQKRGYEVACGICYVESTRREIGRITQDFINSYKESQKTGKPITRTNSEGKVVDLTKTKEQKETTADKSTDKFFAEKDYTPTLADLNTTDIDLVKRDHPLVYEAYLNFMNARGQSKPKLLETRAEYKGEILKHFKLKNTVTARNNAGGLRLQSFSDFEVPHLIDMMQIVMDMSRVGLKSQAYTKVPAFAEVFGDSGVKINLSLIAKGDGLDANGNLIFDDVEGINHKEAFKLRDKYSKNVGTILVGKTDAHIIAAMADPRIDYIIPFHKSSWKESLYDALGLTGYADYTDTQHERAIDKSRGKIKDFDPSEYWDFTKSGDENAQIYLEKCREDGRIPKFPQFQGYPGYWKLLIDFKMYDNDGVGSPQEVVKPVFNTEASERILREYKGGHKSFPVAKDVVEDFVKEHKDKVKYSDRAFSENFMTNTLNSFGIKKLDDSVHIQRQVLDTLVNEDFFTDLEHRRRTDINEELGLVIETNKSGIDETFSFNNFVRLGKFKKIAKLATIRELPNAIKHGHIVADDVANKYDSADKNKTFAYIEYATAVDGKEIVVKLAIKKSPQKNKFWVHSIYTIENVSDSPASTNEGTEAGHIIADSKGIIPQSPNPVKRKFSDRTYSEGLSEADKEVADNVISRLREQKTFGKYYRAFATYTEKRINDEIAWSMAQYDPDYAQTYITWVEPSDYIYATTASEAWREQLTKEAGLLDKERLAKETQPIYLTVDFETGKIKGHEGRHRMIALEKAGVEKVAVIIISKNDQYWKTKPIEVMKLEGQDFGDYKRGVGFFLHNMLPLSERYADVAKEMFSFDSTDGVRFSDRPTESFSNRSLLANALESVAQNDIERNKLKEYKQKIDLINAEEQKLHDLREQIKELSIKKGPRDTEAIKGLQFEANQAANRINVYDKQLLSLESTKALKGVLEREKQMAYKRAEQKGKEALKAQREKDRERNAKTQRELMNRYQESRKKGIESRNKTEVKQSIRKTLKRLNKLLTGSKERSAKEEMKETLASALALGDILFNNDITNRDIVKLGVDSVTEKESKYLNEYHDLLIKKEANDERIASIRAGEIKNTSAPFISDLEKSNSRIEARIAVLNKELSDVFVRERKRLNKAPVSALIYDLSTVYHALQDSKVEYIKNAYNPDLFTMLVDLKKEMDGVIARDMSLAQLEKVQKVFTMIEHSVRRANQYFRDGKFEDLETSASNVMDEIAKFKDTKQVGAQASTTAKSFMWNELTPYYAFEKIGSETLMKYYNDLLKGQAVYARDVKEAKEFAQKTRDKYGYGKWKLDKTYDFKLSDGRTFSTTLKHLLSVYAYSKRKQAESHMRDGGFFHNDKSTYRKEKGILKMVRTDKEGYKVDASVLDEIKSVLGKEKMEYVDEMLGYLTKMGDKGNEATRVLWGVDIFTEEVYFPLKSNVDFLHQSNEPKQAVSLKNDGMTKETKPGASNPIVLEAFDDVWASHIERMSQYHGMVVPIDNLNKVLHYGKWAGSAARTVSTTLKGKFTHAATDYLEQLIDDLNGSTGNKGVENPFWGFYGKWKKTKVGASLSTIVQQPTAILRAMAEIDAKYFVGKPDRAKLSELVEEMQTYAPIAIIKEIGGFDAGAGRQAARWINSDTLTGIDKVSNAIDDYSMKGAEKADQIGWAIIWEAVKRETKATTNLQYGSKEFLEKCGERAEEVINKTQVYDSVLSRSGFMRSKNDSVKMLTAFMGEPTLSMNMLYSAIINAKRGGKGAWRKAARTVVCVYASIIIAEALASTIYALRDEDEDETYIEKYIQALCDGVITDIILAPITSVPGIKDLVSIFEGWNVNRGDMAIFIDLKNAFSGLDSEKKSLYQKIEDFAGALGALYGIPAKNVMRTFREIYNAVMHIIDSL